MALRIRIEHGQDAGKTFRLGSNALYRFGRSPQASVQVLDMKVSKEHFEIAVRGAEGQVRDLGSTHGTLLNGQKVGEAFSTLNSGDEIRVGLTVMRAMSDGPADAEAKAAGPLPSETPAGATSSTSVAGTPAGAAAAPAGATTKTVGTQAARGLPPDALVDTTLAGYRILQKVGAGGMGAVYRAEQLSLHREVAIKVLAEKLVSDSAFVDQFVNEARAAGQLNHPNVVQVYDVGHADGRHFFSMEFIHGGSLEGKIPKTGGGVKWEAVLPWFLDAANALIFAEKKGILHRDIKPDNFMLGQDGSVKLCDLGLAKKSESADLLAQGIIGTPHFIAPEAVRRRTDVDGRADLYSLGCTFFRILTGKNPFPGANVKEILLAHLNAPVPRVSATVPALPKELDDVVFRLMQKDPAARFPSAAELWTALDKIRLQHGMEAHGLHPGRAKKLAIAGGVVAAAAIGLLIYLEPWKDKTRDVIHRIEVPTGGGISTADYNAEKAKARYGEITAEASQKFGRLEDGENWSSKGWDEIVRKYEEMAKNPDFAKSEGARQATAEAKRIVDYRAKRKAAAEELARAISEATSAHEAAAKDGLSKAKSLEATPIEAEKAIDEALSTMKAVAQRTAPDGAPLIAKADADARKQPLEEFRGVLEQGVRASWKAVDTEASRQADSGTAQAMEEAAKAYQGWVDAHPDTASPGAVARAWNETRRAAESKIGAIAARKDAARRKDLLGDRGDYHAWLVKEAWTPRADDGTGGGKVPSFRFSEAADSAAARAKGAKTPEYRALFERRERELRLLQTLPGLLAAGFATKPIRDKVVGNGWSGVPKGVTPDGLQVGDKLHLWSDEGLGWFYDLFYEKGAERYPLDANAHEALGYLAEAAGIVESAPRVDRALEEWKKAAEMDPKRADRLAARAKEAEAEKAVKALLDESFSLVSSATADMTTYEEGIASVDAKKSDAARKEVQAKEGELKARLVKARADLDEVEQKWPTAIGRALLVDVPPADAAYAGETLPAAPDANPKQPHTDKPPPAPVPAAPSMGDAPGMTDPQAPAMGDGSTPAMSGDAGMADAPPKETPGAATGAR